MIQIWKLIFLMSLIFSWQVLGADCSSSFQKGIQAFNQKKFSEAEDHWRECEKEGVNDYRVFYNIGNACYRGGDIACAILNFGRSAQLNSDFEDARYNLQIAEKQRRDKQELVSWEESNTTWMQVYNWLTLQRGPLLTLFLVSLITVLGALMVWFRSSLFRTIAWISIALSFLLLLPVAGMSLYRSWNFENNREAVIMDVQVDIFSGPGLSYTILAPVHAGARVEVLSERNGWVEIQVNEKLKGFIPSESVKKIRQD